MANLTISLDAMGGDFGPAVVVKAAADYLEEHQDVTPILVGDQEAINNELKKLNVKPFERLIVHHTSQKVKVAHPSPLFD